MFRILRKRNVIYAEILQIVFSYFELQQTKSTFMLSEHGDDGGGGGGVGDDGDDNYDSDEDDDDIYAGSDGGGGCERYGKDTRRRLGSSIIDHRSSTIELPIQFESREKRHTFYP